MKRPLMNAAYLGMLVKPAILLTAVVLLLMALSGCATGVQMTAEEASECKAEGCSVWTERELRGLIGEAFKQGYVAGVKSI